MSSLPARRICEANNNCEQRAITSCDGCAKRFCMQHFTEHRALLDNELKELTKDHDLIKNAFADQQKHGDAYELLKQVQKWEIDSIERIKKRAHALRVELTRFGENYTADVKHKFEHLSKDFTKWKEESDCIEDDLIRWRQEINDLKVNFSTPVSISMEEYQDDPLIMNPSINIAIKEIHELFDKAYDNRVQITENGRLVTHDPSNDNVEIRGKNEYSTGCHKVRLRIQETSGRCLFFGINSKSIPLTNQSLTARSSYGWSCDNRSWSSGQPQDNDPMRRIEMRTNDAISLMVDCDNRTIFMINERTKIRCGLKVSNDHCPFPWQLHVVIGEANARVRISQT